MLLAAEDPEELSARKLTSTSFSFPGTLTAKKTKKSRRGQAARAMLDINLLREEKGGNPEIVRESQRRRFADVSLVDQVESCHSCSAQLGHQPPPKHSHSAMRLCIES